MTQEQEETIWVSVDGLIFDEEQGAWLVLVGPTRGYNPSHEPRKTLRRKETISFIGLDEDALSSLGAALTDRGHVRLAGEGDSSALSLVVWPSACEAADALAEATPADELN